MKQGLLLKESPEPRFELFCDRSKDHVNYKLGRCNKQFADETSFEKHMLEQHKQVFILKKSHYHYGKETFWYNVEYLDRCTSNFYQIKYKLPTRPLRRWNCTEEEAANLENKKCWCGKTRLEFDGRQIIYCTKEHNDQWWMKTDYVGPHKDKYLRTIKACEICGEKNSFTWGGGNLEVDHILAIVLGGHPWDQRNLQAICESCHKKKTKSDIGILAWWKRQAKYDIGPIIPNPQTTLDNIMDLDYAFV